MIAVTANVVGDVIRPYGMRPSNKPIDPDHLWPGVLAK